MTKKTVTPGKKKSAAQGSKAAASKVSLAGKGKPAASNGAPTGYSEADSVRDLLYAWTYVTITQIGLVNDSTHETPDVIRKLVRLLKPLVSKQAFPFLKDKISIWVKTIRTSNISHTTISAGYTQAAELLQNSSPVMSWTGGEHPTDMELNKAFVRPR